jgi:hypothetical protein
VTTEVPERTTKRKTKIKKRRRIRVLWQAIAYLRRKERIGASHGAMEVEEE